MSNTYIAVDDPRKPVEDAVEELQTYTEGGRKTEYIIKLMRRLKDMLDFSSQFDDQGRMKQNARKLTYEELFGEQVFVEKTQNNEEIFNPPVTYHGYEMSFLKEHKSFLLPDPVKFQKFKNAILISHLTDNNIQFIKNELMQIGTEMEMDIPLKRRFYLRATDFNWYAANGNIRIPSTFGTVKIKLLLQGYKVKNGMRNPVWRLLDVFDN